MYHVFANNFICYRLNEIVVAKTCATPTTGQQNKDAHLTHVIDDSPQQQQQQQPISPRTLMLTMPTSHVTHVDNNNDHPVTPHQ